MQWSLATRLIYWITSGAKTTLESLRKAPLRFLAVEMLGLCQRVCIRGTSQLCYFIHWSKTKSTLSSMSVLVIFHLIFTFPHSNHAEKKKNSRSFSLFSPSYRSMAILDDTCRTKTAKWKRQLQEKKIVCDLLSPYGVGYVYIYKHN